MTVPTLTVKIAFVSAPLATSPTWVDVTAYVRQSLGVNIDRGGGDPWSPVDAGTLSLTLSNRDRRFDPTYTAGPYFGNLKPGKQIWVYATFGGTDYDLFRGFVDGWPQSFGEAGLDATVELSAHDALSWAAGVRLSSDPYEDYLLAIDTPVMWLRQADASRWDDRQGTHQPVLHSGSITTARAPFDSLNVTGVQFAGATAFNGVDLTTPPATPTVAFWITSTSDAASDTILYYYDYLVAGSHRIAGVTLTNGAPTFGTGDGVDGAICTSSIPVNDGLPHFVAFTFTSGTSTALCYVDGVLDTNATVVTSGTRRFEILVDRIGAGGSTRGTGSLAPADYLTATAIHEVFIVDTILTAAQVAAMYALGRGWVEESVATRATRYLDDAGWPAAWRDITTTGRATCGDLTYNNRQLITALHELERTEQGRLFAAKDGKITLHGRYFYGEATRGNTSQATFSDDGAGIAYGNWGYTPDDVFVRNDITVDNTRGSSRSTDATSITDHGRRSETVNTILSDLTARQDMAAGLVSWWKDAELRALPFSIPPGHSSWATLLGLELGDRITCEQTPMGVGSQLALVLLLRSISWRIDLVDWRPTFSGTPVPPAVFILGTSLLDGTDVLGF